MTWNQFRKVGPGIVSARELREAELFYAELVGEVVPGRIALEEAAGDSPPEWLASAQRLPVTYKLPQMPMEPKILGVVLHSTNHAAGPETLARFQGDWQALQRQSAHFAIDRAGNIGQYRSTREVAWHINGPSVRYFGIEHITKHKEPLTPEQIESSGRLVGELAERFSFPAQRLLKAEDLGIGIHVDFRQTGCGENVFWSGKTDQRTSTFDHIVQHARDYARLGY